VSISAPIIRRMTDDRAALEVRERIAEIASRPHSRQLVAAYFDPERGFAGDMFDGLHPHGLLANNPSARFTGDDIAAASLLDVRFGPTAVRRLLGSSDIAAALSDVPERIALWAVGDEDFRAASRLWSLVREVPGVGRTRASKLLARKRPELVPIVDSVIARALHLGVETWHPLALALQDDAVRQLIGALRPEHVSDQLSILRLLDVVVWMSCSRSRSAVEVQLEVGAKPTREFTS
jgi:hypothetical protein